MNIESRESLLRDGAFDAPRRDSFIRDEFAGSPRPQREPASSSRRGGLDEFLSESDWDEKPPAGFQLRRTEVILAVAVIALIIGGVSVWTLVRSRGAAPEPPAAVAASPVQSETTAAVEPAPAEPPAAVPATVNRRQVPRQVAVEPRVSPGVSTAAPSAPRPSPVRPVPSSQPQANVLTPTLVADTQLETPSTAGMRAEVARNGSESVASNRVYSSADTDVIPPKMLVEDVPAALVVGMRTRMQAVELMVTEEGDVSRVRLLTEQRRILDTMLLSRAKMWRFTPALRQGRPVPYRLVVLWETND